MVNLMKKFYNNAVCFSLVFILALIITNFLCIYESTNLFLAELTNSRVYLSENVGTNEIIPKIQKAQLNDGTTKLIIGDSVCNQMFKDLQQYNDDFSIIGSNAAITMSGQYILAKEYIDHHPDATDIYLLVLPQSLGQSYNTLWGYQYTIMPFVKTNTLQYLDENTISIMKETYGELFLNPHFINMIDTSGVHRKLCLNYLNTNKTGYVPDSYFDIAEQYISKICDMCEERNINFHLYPLPVCESKRTEISEITKEFENSALYNINPNFLDNVVYYPTNESNDQVHFSGIYASQEYYNEKINRMYSDTSLLSTLKLN